ncbi:hypothetical protein ACFFX0_24380 [Citricoccus parietis]|uniref:Uncharacterized protein n=1 Tax=Citricoccus parietis TaxID=592307 RepID=A0ABV5G5D4_9MICC
MPFRRRQAQYSQPHARLPPAVLMFLTPECREGRWSGDRGQRECG